MLHDPKLEQARLERLDPISTRSFVEWLEMKPADACYTHVSPHECAIGQFAGSRGMMYSDFHTDKLRHWEDKIARAKPHTYGAAAARGKALLEEVS